MLLLLYEISILTLHKLANLKISNRCAYDFQCFSIHIERYRGKYLLRIPHTSHGSFNPYLNQSILRKHLQTSSCSFQIRFRLRANLTPPFQCCTLGTRGLFFPFTRPAQSAEEKNKPLVTRTKNLISMQISYHISHQIGFNLWGIGVVLVKILRSSLDDF